MKQEKSRKIWESSQRYIVGGVNSPVRAFNGVGGEPIAFSRGKGCYVKDADGNKYLDFLNSWGPLILGHSPAKVVNRIKRQIKRGTSFGTITQNEAELAELMVKNIPHIDRVRFVNSGTEAVMTAVRLSRHITQKNIIVKFDGCYHGHSDPMLISAGSGLITRKNTSGNSAGLPYSIMQDTFVLNLDDEDELEKCFQKHSAQIAGVIIEPLPANSGLLPQREVYLRKIEKLCRSHKAMLIFDEVITGFRLGFTGFAGKYGFQPDLITYGKIIGGGMPCGAIAGKKTWVSQLAPEGEVYQAGTLSGNPIAMSAGSATLSALLENDVYAHLNALSSYLGEIFQERITPLFAKLDFYISLIQHDSIFWLSINPKDTTSPVRRSDQIWKEAGNFYKQIFWGLIKNQIYTAPSAYEVGFLSYPMSKKNLEHYIQTLEKIVKEWGRSK